MKNKVKLMILAVGLVLAACSSQPISPAPQQAQMEHLADWMSSGARKPATSDEENYRLYKIVIVDSTQTRIEASKKGDYATVCNATGNSRGSDTYIYYVMFEQLKLTNDDITKRLQKELGMSYRNYEYMYKDNLPNRLHNACISHNRGDIDKVMRSIVGYFNMEGMGN